jgi:ribosomal protein S18 acetylase RimI-like enzyme
MHNSIAIRKATDLDGPFILELSPQLAEAARLSWHTDTMVQKFQDNYIIKMLDQDDGPQSTLIAEVDGSAVGFVHTREINDSISEEVCGTVPLLAVAPNAQGRGIGRLLMAAAEEWSRDQGHRLLHLEVFANNDKAQAFYQNLGFQPETLVMIKPLQ